MPDRIVRAAILTSDRVDLLDSAAEVFYRRLMNVVDDFGRFDARLSVLRAACFPLRIDRVREADISRWLAACQKAGLLALYKIADKPHLELLNLGDRRRAKHSKFPPPPAEPRQHMTTSDGICWQMSADDSACQHMSQDSDAESDSDAQAHSGDAASAAGESAGFADFWNAYPPGKRKKDQAGCLKVWKSSKLAKKSADVMTGLRRWVGSAEWADQGGRFIPRPIRWLRESWWEAAPEPSVPEADESGFVRREFSPAELRDDLGLTDEEIAAMEAM